MSSGAFQEFSRAVSGGMISVESLRCRELYDGCYVVFMAFVIRSHDRLRNYDVLCGAPAPLEIAAKKLFLPH